MQVDLPAPLIPSRPTRSCGCNTNNSQWNRLSGVVGCPQRQLLQGDYGLAAHGGALHVEPQPAALRHLCLFGLEFFCASLHGFGFARQILIVVDLAPLGESLSARANASDLFAFGFAGAVLLRRLVG